MYYNIKIIAKDSEFALESQDKTIIEREMDIYFARIFGASDEFVSKIKPDKIYIQNLKSIEEIESPISQDKVKQEKVITAGFQNNSIPQQRQYNAIDNAQVQQATQALQNAAKYQSQTQQKEASFENTYTKPAENMQREDASEEKAQKTNIDQDKLKEYVNNTASSNQNNQENQFKQTDNTQFIKKEYDKIDESALKDIFSAQNQTIQNSEADPKADIFDKENYSTIPIDTKELEQEAENLYKELQDQIKQDTQEINIQETEPTLKIEQIDTLPLTEGCSEDLNINDEYNHTETQNELNISVAEPSTGLPFEIDEPISANEAEEEKSAYQDIINAYKEQNIESKEKQDNVIADLGYKNAISITEEVTGHMLQAPNENKNNENNEPIQNQEASKVPFISFNMFLSGFQTDKINDEFLICAAYIKNVLNQDSFNMKTINSKLFQATGKIADTSVLDELMQKAYIIVIGTDEYTKYSITPQGEEYLAGKLPN